MRFPMLATDWNVYFHQSCRHPAFVEIFCELGDVAYEAEIRDPNKNSGQVTHDHLDHVLTREVNGLCKSEWPSSARDADIVLASAGALCVVEVERANHEKYLRDLLKVHGYLYSGIAVGALVVPENHAHVHGEVSTLKIAQSHVQNAMTFGMWNPQYVDRFFLVSYKMRCAESRVEYSKAIRAKFIRQAKDFHRDTVNLS